MTSLNICLCSDYCWTSCWMIPDSTAWLALVSLVKIRSLWWKDTTLAWLMPTNTAMHLITLAHSLLNLCGSPKWLSRQGYSRPTTAEEQKQTQNVEVSQRYSCINTTAVDQQLRLGFCLSYGRKKTSPEDGRHWINQVSSLLEHSWHC